MEIKLSKEEIEKIITDKYGGTVVKWEDGNLIISVSIFPTIEKPLTVPVRDGTFIYTPPKQPYIYWYGSTYNQVPCETQITKN